MKNRAFLLKWEYTHSGDLKNDAFHIAFEGSNNLSSFISNPKYGRENLPPKILFRANFRCIPMFDFPVTDLNVPIMSTKMLRVLLEIDGITYSVIPVTMIDDTYLSEIFDANGNISPEVPVNETYAAVRLEQLSDYCDKDRSVFRKLRSEPDKPGILAKVVLKIPESGFPSIFRILDAPSKLFISGEAKLALESNGIKGCVFEEVEVSF